MVRTELSCAPGHTMAYVTLSAGEAVRCEPGAMIAMSAGVSVHGGLGGGVVKAVKRRMVGGEQLLMTTYRANIEGAWVALAPRYPGDIAVLEIAADRPVMTQSGCFLAASEAVATDGAYAGLRTMLLHEGLTALRLAGAGPALIASYGGLQRFELAPGEELVVDTGHLVAWDEDLKLRVGALGSVVTSALAGEGLVGLFTGPGTVWLQSRAEQALRSWLTPGSAAHTGRA